MNYDKISIFLIFCIFYDHAAVFANYVFEETDYLADTTQETGGIPEEFRISDDANDFPLFRPPEIGDAGYRQMEHYDDYEFGIGARAKKLPNMDKNWEDLTLMMNYYNDEWELSSEYLTDYGCNCRNNLDRRRPGLGNPYGVIDQGCHSWKQCLKCSQALYGETCTAQDIKYKVELVDGQYTCTNAPGTCRKAICECDLAFAQYTGKHAAEWSTKYWAMDMGGYQHFNTTQCIEPHGGNYKARCCANVLNDLLTMYDNNKQCCDSKGFLHPKGTCDSEAVYVQPAL